MELYERKAWMNIFFDLDGTLVDARQRMYGLFQELIPGSSMTFDEYWELKRNKIGHNQILSDQFSYTDEAIDDFQKRWMKNIELPGWLARDKPFEGISVFLKEIRKYHTLFIVTARQSRAGVLNQVDQFRWLDVFEQIFVTEQKKQKEELIQTVKITGDDWVIGDTGKDIEIGKQLGMNTAAVLSGFMNENRLAAYKPDIIIPGAVDFRYKKEDNE
jgi:phosphoglycolate phosphatase